jgi:hypothetical protein
MADLSRRTAGQTLGFWGQATSPAAESHTTANGSWVAQVLPDTGPCPCTASGHADNLPCPKAACISSVPGSRHGQSQRAPEAARWWPRPHVTHTPGPVPGLSPCPRRQVHLDLPLKTNVLGHNTAWVSYRPAHGVLGHSVGGQRSGPSTRSSLPVGEEAV